MVPSSQSRTNVRFWSSDPPDERESPTALTDGVESSLMAEPYLVLLDDLVGELELGGAGRLSLECRHFFGGAALYADGRICASLTPVGLAVKLPPASRQAMLADGRGRPLRYFDGGKVKREYVVLSEAVAADLSAVRELFVTSFQYVSGE